MSGGIDTHTAAAEPASLRRAAADSTTGWQPLRIFNLYRMTLGGLLGALLLWDLELPPLGSALPDLYYYTTLLYLGSTVVASFAIKWRLLGYTEQVAILALVDITLITLLMHASGGLGSGLGVLLLISVAGAGLLSVGRLALLFAAVATLAVLFEHLYAQFGATSQTANYPQAGILGAAFFATALLAHLLARRLRESEALAIQRGVDLENMAQLTDYVIRQMDTGVVVVDGHGTVRLANHAATELLDARQALTPGQPLETFAPQLAERLLSWREEAATSTSFAFDRGRELKARLIRLGSHHAAGFLIFVEDASQAARQAQQLKLASLGKLTASIAHEIRNPLGAISHAGQLLDESPELDAQDRRLARIVVEQSIRVNSIIKTVLQLGRRERARPELIDLEPWLAGFVEGFTEATEVQDAQVTVTVVPPGLKLAFDPGHLQQILCNLCRNAVEHGSPAITIHAWQEPGRPACIEVRDKGPGIPREHRERLFEPFFSTRSRGNGLGLYISRELAQSNGAVLEHIPTESGAVFRLTLAPPTPTETK